MAIELFEKDMNIIQKLDDEPNDVGGLTAAELKAKFDEGGLLLQDFINKKLIPAASNWERLDNKPFGPVETVLEETVAPFAANSGETAGTATALVNKTALTANLTPGESYRVIWDGTDYLCRCAAKIEGGGIVFNGAFAGNPAAMFDTDIFGNTGEPFFIFGTMIATKNTADSHTIRIVRIKTLDPGWLSASVFNVDASLGVPGAAADAKEVGDRLADAGKRMSKMEQDIADLLYEPISITAFKHSAGTKEMGSTVTEVTLSWSVSRTPTALELDGESVDPALTAKALTGLTVTENRTWKLTATDERGAVATKTATLSFLNGVYYGAGAAPAALDSAFILGLTKTLTSTRKRTVTVDAGQGEYIWYALPVRLGACTFKVGGFEGGFGLIAEQDFTNAMGYTEPYYIYRSGQAGLGSTTVEVS